MTKINKLTDKQTNKQTNCMQQSPSWEANSSSVSRKNSCILWNRKMLLCLQQHATCPYISYINPLHAPTSYFLRSILILFPSICLGHLNSLFPSGFPTKTLLPTHGICVIHFILLNLSQNIIW